MANLTLTPLVQQVGLSLCRSTTRPANGCGSAPAWGISRLSGSERRMTLVRASALNAVLNWRGSALVGASSVSALLELGREGAACREDDLECDVWGHERGAQRGGDSKPLLANV
jgi:hypothetical protein